MKATLQFELPEENDEFETASNGWKYRLILSEFDNFLRSKLKYEDLLEGEYKVYDKVRQELWNLINEENIQLH